VSKNVAVFVDVANIFYAAKAAGVDIDYVTLLKAATAGRDFIRAYAYTGLDPENENQRQFQSFLARNSYRVVSKDIRKYGDGKVKANLDIELVVDLMKTARNVDIAVVVSGDGDFAPAIRAVQEMGVRVEVISFRGNTSSDLIEVADQFTDITQLAKVERGSARSGRRVATEGDLSMTEVPDKETEGTGRRRGGRGSGRTRGEAVPAAAAASRAKPTRTSRAARSAAEAIAAAAATPGAPIVALPGERLSRIGAGEAAPPTAGPEEAPGIAEEETEIVAATPAAQAAASEGEQRRRRRRGGRGRGRGRGREHELPQVAPEGEEFAGEGEDEPYVAPPPRQTPFGSIWDSQIGMVPRPPATGEGAQPEEDEEEPGIPEYLLAERRQGGRATGRGRGRGRGGRSAYTVALDRERFGRPAPGAAGGGWPRDEGSRGRGPRPPRDQGRGQRPSRPAMPAERPTTGGAEPWSEVPPELEELIRAQAAAKLARPETVAETAPGPALEAAPEAKPKRRATPSRSGS